MEWLSDPQIWIALATLTALETVLGIDNIIFISILAAKLPKEQQDKARSIGLALAMITRILLLFSLSWIMRLTNDLFTVFGQGISARDLILITGGMFLIAKSTIEIHHKIEGESEKGVGDKQVTFKSVLIQIILLDIIFSLDSVITAVGMVKQLGVMIAAVIISVAFMMFFAKTVSDFVDEHPTIKVLALSFLVLVGMALVSDGLGVHIPKGHIYFAMAFSVVVEMLNMKLRKSSGEPIELRSKHASE